MAIRAQLKGLPIVLRLSEVREGHFNLPWGEGEMQRERDGQALKQKLRGGRGHEGKKGFLLSSASYRFYTTTPLTPPREHCALCILKLKRGEKPEL